VAADDAGAYRVRPPLLTGSRLALRFTAVGATFAIDDVYVDPFRRMH
jgi:hypothetical protein